MTQNRRPDYTAKSPFVQLLDRGGRVRILDVFLRKHSSELSKTEIARLADIHPSTVGRNIDELVRMDLVKEIGEGERYRLNLENDLVNTLGQFHTELLNHAKSIESSNQLETEIGNDALDLINQRSDEDTDETELRAIADKAISNV